MKIFLKFLKWAGITLGVLATLFIAINSFDEKLDTRAAAIIDAQPKLRPEENAYFYLAGMYTSASNNPVEDGRKCLLAQLKVPWLDAFNTDFKNIPECRESNILKSPKDESIRCDWRKKPCLGHYLEQREAIANLASQNATVLGRYGQLLQFKKFEDIYYDNGFVFIPWGLPFSLYEAISATQLHDGDALGFIRRTQAEANFYRMVLNSESGLLSKMISIAEMERSARLVSDAVHANPELAQNNEGALLEIAQPLNKTERSIEKPLWAELRYFSYVQNELPIDKTSYFNQLLYRLTYKKNASLNYYYQELSVLSDLSKLPTDEYLAAEQPTLKKLNPFRDEFVHLVYNPMGKILAGIGEPAYDSYIPRIIDADGLLRLVSLQIQIAAKKIPESEIPAFLEKSDPKFHDPYTGRPMLWDKSHGLHFKGHSKRITDKDGFVSLKL